MWSPPNESNVKLNHYIHIQQNTILSSYLYPLLHLITKSNSMVSQISQTVQSQKWPLSSLTYMYNYARSCQRRLPLYNFKTESVEHERCVR